MRSVIGIFSIMNNLKKNLSVLGLSAVLPTAPIGSRGTEGNVNSIFSVRGKEHISIEESADGLEGFENRVVGMYG